MARDHHSRRCSCVEGILAGIDVRDLLVKAFLRGAYVLNTPQHLVEVVEGLIRALESFVLQPNLQTGLTAWGLVDEKLGGRLDIQLQTPSSKLRLSDPHCR